MIRLAEKSADVQLCVLFHRFGPYHHARLRAAGGFGGIVALELSDMDNTYAWAKVEGADKFRRVTLFYDADIDTKPAAVVQHHISAILDNMQPQAVVIPGWSSTGALAALSWCLKARIPAIIMSESTAYDESRSWWKEAIKRRIVRLCSAALVGGAPHVDYLSMLGMPRGRIFTGYDAVDNDHFFAGAHAVRLNAAAERARLELPEKYFLASSRFVEKKNLPNLLRAYSLYRRLAGKSAWKFVLLGDGPFKPQLLRSIEELGLGNQVLLPGFKQYNELPSYYGLAGAFIHASTTEQWGLVVNEAMAAGLPVLVSERCGCAEDLIENGRNGFTFDPWGVDMLSRLMLRVASDDCNREAMGQASRDIISHWTPQTFAHGLWRAADVALKSRGPKATLADRALLWALMHR